VVPRRFCRPVRGFENTFPRARATLTDSFSCNPVPILQAMQTCPD
jgi:hypothetical protein